MSTDAKPMSATDRPIWQQILLNKRMLICVFLGLSSGMPLYVLTQLVPGWLRSEEVDLATIGLSTILTLSYNFKFLWAPLVDRYPLPMLGRRRGWILLTQILLLLSIGGFSGIDPLVDFRPVIVFIALTAFFSATQDIVIDGYRRELLPDAELALGNAIHVNAYRIAGLVPGSLAFILSDHIPWAAVYWIVAAFMIVGIVATLLIPEVSSDEQAPRTLQAAVVDPFVEFFTRSTLAKALLILAFILLYKLGDNMAVALQTPFFLDLGYTRTDIGTVAKFTNLGMSVAGGILGGIIMLKISINRALWLFGVVQMTSILGYAWLSTREPNLLFLFAASGYEYLGVGLGAAAIGAFIARESSRQFSVTQLALLLSIATVTRTVAGATTGFIIEEVGYFTFFLICFALAAPGMVLLFWVAPWNAGSNEAPLPQQ